MIREARTEPDPSGFPPMWLQLVGIIGRRVKSGEWPPGTRLPNSRELAERYGVSEVTTRRALMDLANSGVITKVTDAGFYVPHGGRQEPGQ